MAVCKQTAWLHSSNTLFRSRWQAGGLAHPCSRVVSEGFLQGRVQQFFLTVPSTPCTFCRNTSPPVMHYTCGDHPARSSYHHLPLGFCTGLPASALPLQSVL